MSATTKKLAACVLMVSLLTSGFFLVGRVNTARQSLGLTRLELPDQAQPDLLTNVLFSVGRALAVDYLWIGLQKMQEDGRYFDANQRAEWICRLQPHFTAVWVFQAWNMSYNISVAMTNGPDRWRWVKNGYELLRDRGIQLNPKSIGLYQQLAWIFHHKIGAMSDDQHWYYKIQIAKAMEDIIGWPNAKYDAMAKAPDTWEQVVKDPRTAEFVKGLEGFKIDPREKLLPMLADRKNVGEKVLAFLDDPKNAEGRDLVEGFLRAQRLKNEWKMDAKVIAELRTDTMYGPLDFRTPEAHAIYWSYYGFKMTGGDTSFEALNTDRVIYGSLQELVRRGRFIVTDQGVPLITPDINFVPVVHRVYVSLGKKWAEVEGRAWDGTAGETFQSGHVNFLRKSIALCYQYGDEKMAAKYWNIMKKMYPNPEYSVGMEEYIRQYVLEDMKSMGLSDANATIAFFLFQSYMRYGMGDDYSALAMRKWAKFIYDSYMKGRKLKEETGRMSMAEFKYIDQQAQQMALQTLSPNLQENLRARLHITTQPVGVEKAPTP